MITGRWSLKRAQEDKTVEILGPIQVVKNVNNTFNPETVTLKAVLSGFEGITYNLRWSYIIPIPTADGRGWTIGKTEAAIPDWNDLAEVTFPISSETWATSTTGAPWRVYILRAHYTEGTTEKKRSRSLHISVVKEGQISEADQTNMTQMNVNILDLWDGFGNQHQSIQINSISDYRTALENIEAWTQATTPKHHVVKPTVFYKAGDLWTLEQNYTLNGISYVQGDTLEALQSMVVGQGFQESHWQKLRSGNIPKTDNNQVRLDTLHLTSNFLPIILPCPKLMLNKDITIIRTGQENMCVMGGRNIYVHSTVDQKSLGFVSSGIVPYDTIVPNPYNSDTNPEVVGMEGLLKCFAPNKLNKKFWALKQIDCGQSFALTFRAITWTDQSKTKYSWLLLNQSELNAKVSPAEMEEVWNKVIGTEKDSVSTYLLSVESNYEDRQAQSLSIMPKATQTDRAELIESENTTKTKLNLVKELAKVRDWNDQDFVDARNQLATELRRFSGTIQKVQNNITGSLISLSQVSSTLVSRAEGLVENSIINSAQLIAQYDKVLERNKLSEAVRLDLETKKSELETAKITLGTKVATFKSSTDLTETNFTTTVQPVSDTYTAKMKAFQSAITKADLGKDGREPWKLALHYTKNTFKNGVGKSKVEPRFYFMRNDITSRVSELTPLFEWERVTVTGVGADGKTDATWNSEMAGRLFVEVFARDVGEGMTLRVSISEEDENKVNELIDLIWQEYTVNP